MGTHCELWLDQWVGPGPCPFFLQSRKGFFWCAGEFLFYYPGTTREFRGFVMVTFRLQTPRVLLSALRSNVPVRCRSITCESFYPCPLLLLRFFLCCTHRCTLMHLDAPPYPVPGTRYPVPFRWKWYLGRDAPSDSLHEGALGYYG
eukprot:302817-Rhodomonas_salina.1